MNRPFDLAMTILGMLGCLVVGWLWSLSTWHRAFDMGWLAVAFVVVRTISASFGGNRLQAKEYLVALWPALPAFVLEWLADLSLHRFSVYGELEQIVEFSVFSCLLLIVITAATARLKFGIGIEDLSPEEYAMSGSVIRVLALVVSISVSLGALTLLTERMQDAHSRLASLQSWFYKGSLMVYFILIAKTMFPLILERLRATGD